MCLSNQCLQNESWYFLVRMYICVYMRNGHSYFIASHFLLNFHSGHTEYCGKCINSEGVNNGATSVHIRTELCIYVHVYQTPIIAETSL